MLEKSKIVKLMANTFVVWSVDEENRNLQYSDMTYRPFIGFGKAKFSSPPQPLWTKLS